MPTAISIRDLTKRFGTGPGAAAVDRVSLDIAPGELFFLLGPSGCGKTTLLRMIAGFIEPSSGRLLFDGRDVTQAPPSTRNTGMVFQSYALWPHMTVEANVAFGLGIRRVAREEQARRVSEALGAVRMSEYADRKPNQLSGGQQQRVALARALVIRPDVLLLDEPLSNLDAKLRIELRSEIRRICKGAGITAVYVTHDQKEALSMADRVAVISRGQVVQVGPPADLYHNPASGFVAEFLGETNFIPGRVLSRNGVSAIIETAAGRLTSVHPSTGRFAAQAPVRCSIRPEACQLTNPPTATRLNVLEGRVVETVYLGETAQHLLELPGGLQLRVAQLNPGTRFAQTNGRAQAFVSPSDVAIVDI
jgi:iron(III) transport system ATP-binding protein